MVDLDTLNINKKGTYLEAIFNISEERRTVIITAIALEKTKMDDNVEKGIAHRNVDLFTNVLFSGVATTTEALLFLCTILGSLMGRWAEKQEMIDSVLADMLKKNKKRRSD